MFMIVFNSTGWIIVLFVVICTQVKIYASKITYLKKPDYYKLKTFEDQSMTNKDQEFNSVFGTKKLSRMSKLRSSQTVDVTKNIFDNISSSCMYKMLKNIALILNFIILFCSQFIGNIKFSVEWIFTVFAIGM